MRSLIIATVISLVFGAWPTQAQAQVADKKALTLEGARRIIAAATVEAKRQKLAVGVVIAIVDDGGHLILLERMDNTQAGSVEVAIAKARTAALFRRNTKEFEDSIAKGRLATLVLPGATPLLGGIPIVHEGRVIGAVGVSGDAPPTDEAISLAGAAALNGKGVSTLPQTSVQRLDGASVTAAFVKGVPLIETRDFKVHASRREAPGLAEVHTNEIDVIYVLEGEATFVVGGEVVGGKHIAADEIRGPSIKGGKSFQMKKGDVVTVPAGAPHWFQFVRGPFLYYVVKVPVAGQGAGLTACGAADCPFCRPK
ncbi:MAG: heme-binding protein [Gemmataceae bacterium]|nr:heme-binding protein [Gemmataceae bacterium]